MYDESFPKFKNKLNQRKNVSPWITKGIEKLSERKQKLYEKFLKKEMLLMKQPTKLIKIYLRQLSVSTKKTLLTKDTPVQICIKKRWTVMKEITGNVKHNKKSNFPQKLKIGNKTKTGEDEIANKFNKYFADIGLSLAKDIPNPSIPFETFLKRVNTTWPSQSLSTNEVKDVFFSL